MSAAGPPRLSTLARTWLTIGSQSLGGGPSTLYLMRLLLVERLRWISQREFLEDWALSRLSPGVHMVALAGLLGRRTGGARGTAVAVLMLMLPSGLIAASLAAGYTAIRDQPLVQAALAGAGPVTIGLTIGITYPFAKVAARSGRRGLVDWSVLVVAALIGLAGPSSPILVILAGAVFGAIFLGKERPASTPPPD